MDIQTRIGDFVSSALLLGSVLLLFVWIYRDRAGWKALGERLDTFFAPERPPTGNVLGQLFVVSFATLYIEMMLIRWIGTEVRIFAFFQNLALIACFLGFGLGCYWSRRRKSLPLSLAATAALVILAQAPIERWKNFLRLFSQLLSLFPDAALWGYEPSIQNFHGEIIVTMVALAIKPSGKGEQTDQSLIKFVELFAGLALQDYNKQNPNAPIRVQSV